MTPFHFVVLFLLSLASSQNSSNSSNASCNSSFYSSARFAKWNLTRPPYLSAPAISSNLSYCSLYNNVSSCCDSTTDQQIANYYSLYKTALANITSQRIHKMKTLFDQYQNLSVDPSLTNVSNLNQTIQNLTNDIKKKWILTNQQLVSCAQAALKLSVGLLCNGCSPNNTLNIQNDKLILNRNACLVLAQSCFSLIQSLNNTQNSSIDNVMNLTDAISSYIGDTDSNDNTTDNSSIALFGNLTDNSSRRLQVVGPASTINITTIKSQAIIAFIQAFPSLNTSSFIFCDTAAINTTKCQGHPLLLNINNQTFLNDVLTPFQQKSAWGFIPVLFPLTITGLTSSQKINLTLPFFFVDMTLNINLIKFLQTKRTLDVKTAKITDIENSMIQAFNQFIAFYNATAKIGTGKNILDKSQIRSQFNDINILACVFKGVIADFKSVNKSIYTDTCDFNITLGNASTSLVCGSTITNDIKNQLNSCSQQTSQFSNISGTCSNHTCIVCLDATCFTQNFTYQPCNQSDELNYTTDEGRQQFAIDPKLSLKTGKRIPDFINIPDTSFLTNYTFTVPCVDLPTCSVWFCTNFLRGPVARIENIYNPQEASSDLDDNATNLYTNNNSSTPANNSTRILQTTSTDTTVSDTGGVDFNLVANQTNFNNSITIDGIDGVSSGSSNSTNGGSSNTNSTSFGDRIVGVGVGVIGLVLSLFMI